MQTGSVILGSHALFFRDGASFTVPSSGTAGRSSKPGAADNGWIDLGIINDVTIEHKRDELPIYAPTPGVMRLYRVLETKRELNIKMTGMEMSAFMFELLFGTLALTSSSTQYNPLEGSMKEGWLKLQTYTHTDGLFNTVDNFVNIKISNATKISGGEIVSADYEARVLHSIYNTGTLA